VIVSAAMLGHGCQLGSARCVGTTERVSWFWPAISWRTAPDYSVQ
jgi:hypothetical protein